ncbi:hypothetical protein [Alphaproteobacteria bacterium endosymbiont of Tiliacea citrago]|uniref:hypothetical protein n=1 Tax=Alphaproteobacteria bacterium endosymbiont of Tiliacea citrago TaxID=3077944 RepID=UPI00313DAC3C
MIFIFFCFCIFFVFYLNYKKKRIAPLNPDNYILSPIDGYVANVKSISIDDVLYLELTLNFSFFSDRNLFALARGELVEKEQTKDKVSFYLIKNKANIQTEEIDLSNNVLEITHHSNSILSKLNFFSDCFVSFYEKSWTPAINYGWMLYGDHVKVLLNASSVEMVASSYQNLIGGESILAVYKNSHQDTIKKNNESIDSEIKENQ